MNTPANDQQHSPSVQALGPRPGPHDPLLTAARAANIGARLELDRQRGVARPDDALGRRLERIEAAIADLADRLDQIADHRRIA